MTDYADPAAQYDTPEEAKVRALKAARDRIAVALAQPEWQVLVEYLQDRFRQRLAASLYGEPAGIAEAQADMRAILSLAKEFGTADLQIEGSLLNLKSDIAGTRQSLMAQLGLPVGDEDGQVT